jgi:hypothetical protein
MEDRELLSSILDHHHAVSRFTAAVADGLVSDCVVVAPVAVVASAAPGAPAAAVIAVVVAQLTIVLLRCKIRISAALM